MCTPKVPDIPPQPERQAARLPDGGSEANASTTEDARRRRILMAGLMTSPSGLGAPVVSRPTLG